MAKDDKDIDEMISRIEFLKIMRRRHSGKQRSFAEEFYAALDREGFFRRSWGQRAKEQFAMARNWIQQKAFLNMYGYPRPQIDDEGLMLVDILLNEGRISQDEWRRVVWQRIVRRADDGGLDVVGPTRRSLFIGKAATVPLILVISNFVVVLLAEPFHFFSGISWAFGVGGLVGLTCKGLYDCTLGHRELAKKLRYLNPSFRLRLS